MLNEFLQIEFITEGNTMTINHISGIWDNTFGEDKSLTDSTGKVIDYALIGVRKCENFINTGLKVLDNKTGMIKPLTVRLKGFTLTFKVGDKELKDIDIYYGCWGEPFIKRI